MLRGRTRGYKHHPQLARFRAARAPVACIAAYLRAVHREAVRRGYRFDARRIARARAAGRIPVTRGQLAFEWSHLARKLRRRDPSWLVALRGARPRPHPLFRVRAGAVEDWERPRPRGR